MRLSGLALLLVPAAVAVASPALAHVGAGAVNSFSSGVGHPLGGLDHILAMVAVGLWGAVSGGRALWVWPAVFVSVMLAGFAVASAGVSVPFVEPAILASGIVLGLAVLLAVRAPVWGGAFLVGIFAFFHGHAHGSEAGGASLIPYAAGFALATAALHLTGMAFGLAPSSRWGTAFARGLGGAIAVGGFAIAGGVL